MGMIRLVALAIALGLMAFSSPLKGPNFEAALEKFSADSFGDTEAGIAAVATSGHAMAAPVIEALQDARLLFDADSHKIFIKDKAGQTLDAVTGKSVADAPSDLKIVRINN